MEKANALYRTTGLMSEGYVSMTLVPWCFLPPARGGGAKADY